MPTVRTDRAVGLEEAQSALAEALGRGYRVEMRPGSRPALRVKRNAVIGATVRVTSNGGGTTFRVSGDGLIVLKLITTPTIARTVTAKLTELYSPGAR